MKTKKDTKRTIAAKSSKSDSSKSKSKPTKVEPTKPAVDETKRAHKLDDSDRVEMLTTLEARARNSARRDSRRWRVTTAKDDVARAVTPKVPLVGKDREAASAAAKHADADWYAKWQASRSTSSTFAKPNAVGVQKTSSESGRTLWRGHSMTALLRRLGKDGWSFDEAKALLDLLKIKSVGDSTIKTGLSDGRSGKWGKPATLTADDQKELSSLRKQIKAKE